MLRNVFQTSIFISAFTLFVTTAISANEGDVDHTLEVKQAMLTENIDLAKELIETTLESHPSDAESHRVAGDIYITRARSVNLFSAAGLAKKGLKSYLKAVELQPKNTRYRLNLLQYYLNAPSIVGGDKDKAIEQAEEIQKLNPVIGVIAQAFINKNNENWDAQKSLFASISAELASEPQVQLEKAQYLLDIGEFDQGFQQLNDLEALNTDNFDNEDDKKVPIKALLYTGFFGLKEEGIDHTEKSIMAFEKYIEIAPQKYGYPSKNWIRFSLAKLYAQNEQTELAKAAFEQVQAESQSKLLLKETKKALKKL